MSIELSNIESIGKSSYRLWSGVDMVSIVFEESIEHGILIALARYLRGEGFEVIHGHHEVAVYNTSRAEVETVLQGYRHEILAHQERRLVDIEICCDARYSWDANKVSEACGMSFETYLAKITELTFEVSMIGFLPGFPYMRGLAADMHVERHREPRKLVFAGALAVGHDQVGIYPRSSPGGWNIIGRAGPMVWNAAVDPPNLLEAGDKVRFTRMIYEDFVQKYGTV